LTVARCVASIEIRLPGPSASGVRSAPTTIATRWPMVVRRLELDASTAALDNRDAKGPAPAKRPRQDSNLRRTA